MSFLRSVATAKTTAIIAAIPTAAAIAASSSSSSKPSTYSLRLSKNPSFWSVSCSNPILRPAGLAFAKSYHPPSAVQMEAPSSDQHLSSLQDGAALPELLTEFMVEMSCEGCVKSVKSKLQAIEGVKNVDVDLSNQVVKVLGSLPVKTLTEALEQTGRKARLIGQGVPEDFLISAAVAEFKGPDIFGVVRFAQVTMEMARIEANFTGLSPGRHGWSINQYGDLTRGAASTGNVYNPTPETENQPLGDLGTLDVDEKGEAFFSGVKEKLRIVDLIGRAIVVYETEDKSDRGIKAAVIARSAGVGENYKKLCTCDGVTIWEANAKI
ncbi:PREDICTED: copper chaperone for superoxide dismutase, chloroplastic [Ipomoea nil]|uniref:copper chaperone for superoxide dismutase, chloroplastic n=1 Tax=Ipomoea nil TaxID=35883 RepID=UPI000900F339|nr:PREDICTED: copper chaperone for superoxide dismutase, chloroplastic [Ipomoea nil]